jgi:hypothetical protein
MLKTLNMMLISVRGYGYKIAHWQEQSQHGEFRRIRGRRQISKGIDELTNIDTSEMSQAEKVRLTHFVNHLVQVHSDLSKRQLESLEKTKEAVVAQEDNLGAIEKIERDLRDLKLKLGV